MRAVIFTMLCAVFCVAEWRAALARGSMTERCEELLVLARLLEADDPVVRQCVKKFLEEDAGRGRGLPSRDNNSIGMVLVLIRPGTFKMGSEERSRFSRRVDETPAHVVEITKPFYLGATEVTQAQWCAVMGSKSNPSRRKSPGLPVTGVSWEDCQEFCRRLTELERQSGRLSATARYGLPTEAEWEYACRAGSTTKYCFGDDRRLLGEYAWYRRNAGSRPKAVRQKRPNAWGLYDMHGNAAEWCQDWYSSQYYGKCQKERLCQDPQGPEKGTTRVLRGRSWLLGSIHCRSSARHSKRPSYGLDISGFRVCLRPQ